MNNLCIRKLASKTFAFRFFMLAMGVLFLPHCLQASGPTVLPQFHVKSQWNLGGEGGWGFLVLDAPAHRLYIPRTNLVMVVDSETGKLIGEVEDMKNIRDIALDDSGRYGYVTDLTDGSEGFVRVFDRSSLKLVTSVSTGAVPAAIIFDPVSKSVFAFNSHGHSVTVIDAATNQVVATIPLSGRPSSAITDGKGSIFVALPARGEITRIDAVTRSVAANWQLAPCTGPNSLAIDAAHHQLFTTCENHNLVAVDAGTGHVTTIGQVSPGAGDIDFSPKQNLVFVADIDGTLSIFRRESPTRYAKVQQVKTQTGARTMIASHQDSKAYLVTSKYGQNSTVVSEELQYRPTPVPGTFSVIVVQR
ncbi:YncE family protein [Granulicella mallensis]|uniref:YVTN family beta-propeller protein n=1 Tax=Granulicella mallensis TaxID=940614 RepID=A0A7W7ZRF0_9BACT|nr:YncE family protein [Granulicella mallensis]MBB5064761.1 YVTN family beta-propeller protein [Granulicella mallensis]